MARLRSSRPGCPDCGRAIPRARLQCPHCDREVVSPQLRHEFEAATRSLVEEIAREPWMASGRLLSYALSSTQRGFLKRHSASLELRLRPLVDRVRETVEEPGATLLLEHLQRGQIRPHSRMLARFFERYLDANPTERPT